VGISVSPGKQRLPLLGYNCFLPNPVQFIDDLSSCHLTPCSLATDRIVNYPTKMNRISDDSCADLQGCVSRVSKCQALCSNLQVSVVLSHVNRRLDSICFLSAWRLLVYKIYHCIELNELPLRGNIYPIDYLIRLK
jgi:hypothetical protein